jgi:hypothetical protein
MDTEKYGNFIVIVVRKNHGVRKGKGYFGNIKFPTSTVSYIKSFIWIIFVFNPQITSAGSNLDQVYTEYFKRKDIATL